MPQYRTEIQQQQQQQQQEKKRNEKTKLALRFDKWVRLLRFS